MVYKILKNIAKHKTPNIIAISRLLLAKMIRAKYALENVDNYNW